jgi:hypothetical protein
MTVVDLFGSPTVIGLKVRLMRVHICRQRRERYHEAQHG